MSKVQAIQIEPRKLSSFILLKCTEKKLFIKLNKKY